MAEEHNDKRADRGVVNDEEQHSIWLADRALPSGRRAEGTPGRREECLTCQVDNQGSTTVFRTMLKSKIHRATVTQADLPYVIPGERGGGVIVSPTETSRAVV